MDTQEACASGFTTFFHTNIRIKFQLDILGLSWLKSHLRKTSEHTELLHTLTEAESSLPQVSCTIVWPECLSHLNSSHPSQPEFFPFSTGAGLKLLTLLKYQ